MGGNEDFWFKFLMGEGEETRFKFEEKLSMCDIFWVVATQIFFIFTPKVREDFQFDEYFSNGLKPPTSFEWLG